MPGYDYVCNTCEREFEERHSIHDIPDQVPCEDAACSGTAHRKRNQGGATVDTKPCSSKFPYVSNRLPRNTQGCTTDSIGRPVIMSRQHEDQVFKSHGYERE